MRLLLIVALLVAADGKAKPGSCSVSDWSDWSDWTSPGHVSIQRSQTAGEKTGSGRQIMRMIVEQMEKNKADRDQCRLDGTCPLYEDRPSEGRVNCINGMANDLPCMNIDQMSFLSIPDLYFDPQFDPSPTGSDIWGWTDPLNGDEYAIMTLSTGTSFVKITDPENPVLLAHISTTGNSPPRVWRDVKTIGNIAYIVSEEYDHGVQVFDMTRLRDITNPPVRLLPDTTYTEVGNCHNIASNEETGFLYAVACTFDHHGAGYKLCNGGLHVMDVNDDPLNPTYAGCFGDDDLIHDTQCIVYNGPHVEYQGREICFNYDEEHFVIADVTDKSNMQLLSKVNYTGVYYTHQGWITDDHTTVLMDDEQDEFFDPDNKAQRTLLWDVTDLRNPILKNVYMAPFEAIDHNQYIKDGLVYQANYKVGLRILNIDQPNYNLQEVAYFDVFPGPDGITFEGAWSVYPYFPSGNIVVSSIEYGLFTLRPNMDAIKDAIDQKTVHQQRLRYRELLQKDSISSCPSLIEYQHKAI